MEVREIRHHSKPAFIFQQGFPKENEDQLVVDPTKNRLVPSRSKDVFGNWKAKACPHGSFGPGITKKALQLKKPNALAALQSNAVLKARTYENIRLYFLCCKHTG